MHILWRLTHIHICVVFRFACMALYFWTTCSVVFKVVLAKHQDRYHQQYKIHMCNCVGTADLKCIVYDHSIVLLIF